MNAQDAIRTTAETSAFILKTYFSDLEDAELLESPGEGCNCLAWQLGHLISSECHLLEMVEPGAAIELPDGFAETYSTENSKSVDKTKLHTKEEYLRLLDEVREATMASLERTSETDLDAPSPEKFREMFPTVGHMYILLATHDMMHAGQFVPVRRKLGKAILI
ncbi:DinB family protein [Adhaeretor mobilis]|uniref:DinB superfamily protein n=1 Tax=Adhaeretor mobilis TaxID=1930276 RepID=A0A517N069_9BACT|nr:DinB family protein [Adhaeretor mobilis]QDT00532.1 DinB superfamily protein [Adhaeretor mobilis]